MQIHPPRLFGVDDDRAVLTLVGTGVTCLDVLRMVRDVSPQCEAVLMTGYGTLDAAVDAMKERMRNASPPSQLADERSVRVAPIPLVEVERDHIVRTLEQVGGNKAVAARLLGVSRRAFYRQLERHGLHQRVPAGRRSAAVIEGSKA